MWSLETIALRWEIWSLEENPLIGKFGRYKQFLFLGVVIGNYVTLCKLTACELLINVSFLMLIISLS